MTLGDTDKVNTNKADFIWQLRVYYEDTDAAGVVFYASYLRYMERARTEWLRKLGFEQRQLVVEYGIIFAVCSLNIKYHKPALLDDLIEVATWAKKIGKASIYFDQVMKRNNRELIYSATVKVVCLNSKTLSPVALPKKFLG